MSHRKANFISSGFKCGPYVCDTRLKSLLEMVQDSLRKGDREMADEMFSRGKKIVLVKMKKPKLPLPKLELMMSGSR